MLSNLFTQSPEALEAQKEQKANNRAARQKELGRLQKEYDRYTNERSTQYVLPEDKEYAKKFLRDKIVKIQADPSITEDQLLSLTENKDSVNFKTLEDAMTTRFKVYSNLTSGKAQVESVIEDAKKSKTKPPQDIVLALEMINKLLAWFKKTKFETADVYEAKINEGQKTLDEKTKGVGLDNPEEIKKVGEAEIKKLREEFSIYEILKDVAAYVGGYLSLFLIFTAVLLGASLASNLNIYRNWSFRLLYALYGGLFFFIVIPYTIFYRWLMLGKRPKFYSLIPLMPYHWNNHFVQILLGWMSFRPDNDVYALKEWENVAV
jgi:hypothetical protein